MHKPGSCFCRIFLSWLRDKAPSLWVEMCFCRVPSSASAKVNNIVIEGFVSSIAVSLQHLCEILDPLIIAKHEMLPLFEVKIELQDSKIIFEPPFQSAKPGDISLRSTIDGWLKDFFATVTCMQRLDTNSGDYLSEIREHFQMQCLLALVSELIDNTEMKCMDYRETFMQHSLLDCNLPQ